MFKTSSSNLHRFGQMTGLSTVLVTLAACTTIQSERVEMNDNSMAGLTYFLPKRMMKVTVTPQNKSLKDLQVEKAIVDANVKVSQTNIDQLQKALLASIEAQTKGAAIPAIVTRETSKQEALSKIFTAKIGEHKTLLGDQKNWRKALFRKRPTPRLANLVLKLP